MLGTVVQRFLCRRYSSRLTAYNEETLDSATRARVAAHLGVCPNCRAERAELEAVAALLRTRTPVAASPATDLWAKLEARIQAEAPRPEIVFVPQPQPRFAWNAFGSSFASAGAVVSIAVVCSLAVLQKGLEIYPGQHRTPIAMSQSKAVSDNDTVTISLLPRNTGNVIDKNTRINAISPVRSIAPQMASTRNHNPVKSSLVQSAGASLSNQSPSSFARSVSPLSSVRMAVASEPRPARIMASKANVSLRFVSNSEQRIIAPTRRKEVTGVSVAASPRIEENADSVNATAFTQHEDTTVRDSNYAFAAMSSSMSSSEGSKEETARSLSDSSARLPLRQVAWVPDAELERRAVPASASAADALMEERQRQTLFSYSR